MQKTTPVASEIAVVGVANARYESLPVDFLEDVKRRFVRFSEVLHGTTALTVTGLGVAANLEDAANAASIIEELRPSAVLIVPFNAARADLQWRIVEHVDVPIAIAPYAWNRSYPVGYRPVDSVAQSASIGAQAIANVLTRYGREFLVVEADEASPQLVAWLRAAHLARRFGSLRFGLVGGRFEGMLDVHLDTARFQDAFGATWEEVQLGSGGPAARVPELPRRQLEALAADELRHSRRLCRALLEASNGFDAMAVNCHSAAIAGNPYYGVTGCLGVSQLTSGGVPATCTADMPTAVAMVIASRISGGSQYVEVDAPDRERHAILLSNGGELDTRMAVRETVGLRRNRFFTGARGRGIALDGALATGPATIVAFTTTSAGWRLVTMEGYILDERLPTFEVPHAFFRPLSDVLAAAEHYGNAGPPHHAAVAIGHIGEAVRLLGRRLEIEVVSV